MNLSRHCLLCENQIINFKTGTTCKLTGKKPAFINTCSKIDLKDKFEEKITEVNIEFEQIRKRKALTIFNFTIFLFLGIAVILAGYYIGSYILDNGVISTIPIVIMLPGLTLVLMALNTLSAYMQDIKAAKMKKDRMDEVITLYDINYTIDIEFGREIHGDQELNVDLKVHGNKR